MRKLIKMKDEIREMDCNEVYEQFKKYIFKTAWGFLKTGEDIDELVQSANVGLVKAFNSYKIETGNFFMTFLATVINNEILMYLRKVKKIKNERSLEDIIWINNDGHSVKQEDALSDEKDYAETSIDDITIKELKTIISNLKPTQKKALNLFYFGEKNQYEVGEELEMSQSYISSLLRDSRKTLKNKYEKGV